MCQDTDYRCAMIDATMIHVTIDAPGNSTGVHVGVVGLPIWKGGGRVTGPHPSPRCERRSCLRCRVVLGDSAGRGVQVAVIPSNLISKVQCAYVFQLLKAWQLIKKFSVRLKQYRAIATRYDKTATSFLGAILLVTAIIWLNC